MTRLMPTFSPTSAGEDLVLLTVPASSAYLGVLRTATAGLAARLQFTLDDIEDLRIAVDEACAMLIAHTGADAELHCRFAVDAAALTVETTVQTTTPGARLPAEDSFAWQVLTALTDEAKALTSGRSLTIQLAKRRPALG